MSEFWTRASDDVLAEAWASGLGTKAIGAMLKCTKNAVIGRARRLGLPARGSPIKGARASTVAPGETRPKLLRARRAAAASLPSSPRPRPETRVAAACPRREGAPPGAPAMAPAVRVPAVAGCQWPLWGSNHFPECCQDPGPPSPAPFCGAAPASVRRLMADGAVAEVPGPYCAEHAARAFRKPEERT